MPSFRYNEIEINHLMEGSGEPIVFVSGSYTKLQMWNYQIDYFKDKMTVVAFDNRGSGKSSRPDIPYTMEIFVEDLGHDDTDELKEILAKSKNVILLQIIVVKLFLIKFYVEN